MFDAVPFQVTLPASDLERAEAWYAEVFGLQPTDSEDPGGVWYTVGGVRFLLYVSEFAGTNEATAATISPSDFDGAIALLRSRGVVFEEYDFDEFKTIEGVMTLPTGQRAAWLKDSEGNILSISSQ